MPTFTLDYLTKVKERLSGVKSDFLKDYSIEIDGEMGMPPLLDIIRYLSEIANGETTNQKSKEMILKYAILGKKVTLFYKGALLGAFTMNSMADPLESFDVLRKNPPALMLLMEITSSRMVEKSMPPQEGNGQPAAAGKDRPQSAKWLNGKLVES